MNNFQVWVYRIGSLGDALVSLPAMHSIRAKHPNAQLVLLTNDSGANVTPAGEVLRHSDLFSDVVTYREGSKVDMARLLLRIRMRRPTCLYYLAPFRSPEQRTRDTFFFRTLAGVPDIIGLDSQSARATPNSSMERVKRESQRLLEIVDSSRDVDDVSAVAMLNVPAEARASAMSKLDSAGLGRGAPVVTMVVGSKMQSKRWPLDHFKDVARRLGAAVPALRIALLGSSDEAELAGELAAAAPGICIDLAGRTSLMEAAAVLQLSALYVGNDTGTMHLAAAVGTPCIAVFSARDVPGKWEPFGKVHRILRAEVPCAGCMLEVCDRRLLCLTEITVDQVMAELRRILPGLASHDFAGENQVALLDTNAGITHRE